MLQFLFWHFIAPLFEVQVIVSSSKQMGFSFPVKGEEDFVNQVLSGTSSFYLTSNNLLIIGHGVHIPWVINQARLMGWAYQNIQLVGCNIPWVKGFKVKTICQENVWAKVEGDKFYISNRDNGGILLGKEKELKTDFLTSLLGKCIRNQGGVLRYKPSSDLTKMLAPFHGVGPTNQLTLPLAGIEGETEILPGVSMFSFLDKTGKKIHSHFLPKRSCEKLDQFFRENNVMFDCAKKNWETLALFTLMFATKNANKEMVADSVRAHASLRSTQVKYAYQSNHHGVEIWAIDYNCPKSRAKAVELGLVMDAEKMEAFFPFANEGEVDGMFFFGENTIPTPKWVRTHKKLGKLFQARLTLQLNPMQISLLEELDNEVLGRLNEAFPHCKTEEEKTALYNWGADYIDSEVKRLISEGKLPDDTAMYCKGLGVYIDGMLNPNVILLDLNSIKCRGKDKIKAAIKLDGAVKMDSMTVGLLQDESDGSLMISWQFLLYCLAKLPNNWGFKTLAGKFAFELAIARFGDRLEKAISDLEKGMFSESVAKLINTILLDAKDLGEFSLSEFGISDEVSDDMREDELERRLTVMLWNHSVHRNTIIKKVKDVLRRSKYAFITEAMDKMGLSFPAKKYLLDFGVKKHLHSKGINVNYKISIKGQEYGMSYALLANDKWWSKWNEGKAESEKDKMLSLIFRHPISNWGITHACMLINPKSVGIDYLPNNAFCLDSNIIKMTLVGDTDGDTIGIIPLGIDGVISADGSLVISDEQLAREDGGILYSFYAPHRFKTANVEDWLNGSIVEKVGANPKPFHLGEAAAICGLSAQMIGQTALLQGAFHRCYNAQQEGKNIPYNFEKDLEILPVLLELGTNLQKKDVKDVIEYILCNIIGWRFGIVTPAGLPWQVGFFMGIKKNLTENKTPLWKAVKMDGALRLADMQKDEDPSYFHGDSDLAWGIFQESGINDAVAQWQMLYNVRARRIRANMQEWSKLDNTAWKSTYWNKVTAHTEWRNLTPECTFSKAELDAFSSFIYNKYMIGELSFKLPTFNEKANSRENHEVFCDLLTEIKTYPLAEKKVLTWIAYCAANKILGNSLFDKKAAQESIQTTTPEFVSVMKTLVEDENFVALVAYAKEGGDYPSKKAYLTIAKYFKKEVEELFEVDVQPYKSEVAIYNRIVPAGVKMKLWNLAYAKGDNYKYVIESSGLPANEMTRRLGNKNPDTMMLHLAMDVMEERPLTGIQVGMNTHETDRRVGVYVKPEYLNTDKVLTAKPFYFNPREVTHYEKEKPVVVTRDFHVVMLLEKGTDNVVGVITETSSVGRMLLGFDNIQLSKMEVKPTTNNNVKVVEQVVFTKSPFTRVVCSITAWNNNYVMWSEINRLEVGFFNKDTEACKKILATWIGEKGHYSKEFEKQKASITFQHKEGVVTHIITCVEEDNNPPDRDDDNTPTPGGNDGNLTSNDVEKFISDDDYVHEAFCTNQVVKMPVNERKTQKGMVECIVEGKFDVVIDRRPSYDVKSSKIKKAVELAGISYLALGDEEYQLVRSKLIEFLRAGKKVFILLPASIKPAIIK